MGRAKKQTKRGETGLEDGGREERKKKKRGKVRNREERNDRNGLGIYAIARQMLPWSKGIRNGSLWKRREDCREKGEVTDPSDPARSSTTMAYLTRRIPLRHGTPQIRKAQIPRSPCGFTGRRERLESEERWKKEWNRKRKGAREEGRGRRRRLAGGSDSRETHGVGNEKEKEFQRSDGRDWEVQFGRTTARAAAKGIRSGRSILWIFDISPDAQSTCQNSNFEH